MTRGWWCSTAAMSGLAPVPGGRVNVGIVLISAHLARAAPHDGAEPRPRRRWPPCPPPTTTQCRGRRHGSATRSRARRPSGAGLPAVPGATGCSSATRPGSSTHSPARDSIARSGPRSSPSAAIDRHPRRRHRRARRATTGASRRRTPGKGRRQPARPGVPRGPGAFDYAARRLADRPTVRETMGLVIGDLAPASTAFDPRFLVPAAAAVTETGQRPRAARAAGPDAPRGLRPLPRRRGPDPPRRLSADRGRGRRMDAARAAGSSSASIRTTPSSASSRRRPG